MSTTNEVLAAARHLVQAFGRHDTEAYFGCFAPDATFIFHTTAARLASRDVTAPVHRTWDIRAEDYGHRPLSRPALDGYKPATCLDTLSRAI